MGRSTVRPIQSIVHLPCRPSQRQASFKEIVRLKLPFPLHLQIHSARVGTGAVRCKSSARATLLPVLATRAHDTTPRAAHLLLRAYRLTSTRACLSFRRPMASRRFRGGCWRCVRALVAPSSVSKDPSHSL